MPRRCTSRALSEISSCRQPKATVRKSANSVVGVAMTTLRSKAYSRSSGSTPRAASKNGSAGVNRSEEHTSELQSRGHLVCRLLLEKKKKKVYKERRSRIENNE